MASTAPLSPGLVGRGGGGCQKRAWVTTQAGDLQGCSRRRTAKGHHSDILVAERCERFRIRSWKPSAGAVALSLRKPDQTGQPVW
jgi:hypothetical protein